MNKEESKAKAEVENAKQNLLEYIKGSGGMSNIREADNKYNDLNRDIVNAIYDGFGSAYLLNVNYGENGDTKEKVAWTEYTGQMVYNFEFAICVPRRNDALECLILEWRNKGSVATLSRISNCVSTCGGQELTWF